MDTWMKLVWALAALAVGVSLVALGSASTSGAGTPRVTPTSHYFTRQDRDRGIVEYGVRENGCAIVYRTAPIP